MAGGSTSVRSKYRAALFDLDDTIFDHQHHRRQALAALRDRFPALGSASLEELERVHDLHLQRTHSALLANTLSLSEARTQRLRGMFSDFGFQAAADEVEAAESAYRAAYDRQWRPVPGARELLAHLRRMHVQIAVITNGRTLEQTAKIRALGVQDAVDAVFTSEAVGSEKPAREFFAHVLGRLSAGSSQCIVIGDLWETDIQGALDSGIDAIWLNRYGRTCPPTSRVSQITSLEPVEEILRFFTQPV